MTEQTLSNNQILTRFTSSGDKLQSLVADLSETDLDVRTEAGGWTIRQVIHHLADDGDVWSLCIKKAIATPGALIRFEGFPGNQPWAQALDFEHRGTSAALDLVGAHRRYLAHLLEHFPADWDRSVEFANDQGEIVGQLTVGAMLKMLAEHMLEHLETIEAALSHSG